MLCTFGSDSAVNDLGVMCTYTKEKRSPYSPSLPCEAWTPRNTDKGFDSTWLYIACIYEYNTKKSVFPVILILRK